MINFFKTFTLSLFPGTPKNIQTQVLGSDSVEKSIFFNYLDAQRAIVMFFSPLQGWVGGNLAFYNTFGFENMETFRSRYRRISDFFNDENYVVFADNDEAWLRQLAQGREHAPRVRMKLPDGSVAVYELRSSAFKKDENGLYFLEMTDVTLEERSTLEIEVVEASKRKFLNNISHEFRTPMNGILGFMELLRQSEPTPKQEEYIGMVDRSAKHMMSTIETLLDLAQMQSGRLRLSVSEFSPIREFERLLEPFYYEAQQHGIVFNVFVDPKLPTYLIADYRKLRQIISQLLDNALKFTESGGKIYAEIRIMKVAADNRYTLGFVIKDTGIGIDDEQLKLITEPFESGEHPDHRLGVGLSLVEGLLKMMGAELRVESKKGIGSEFSFDLEMQGAAEPALNFFADKRAKVVLFDDALATDANMLSRYLTSFGISVSKAHHYENFSCEGIDLLYIVATNENSEWMMQLASVTNGCRIIMLKQDDKPLPEGAAHLVEYALSKPLLASTIADHLAQIFKINDREVLTEKLPKNKIRALIVEDNRINQRLIKLLLEQYGIIAETADNGSDAVEHCRHSAYDIIFMDIDMPVKDGILATSEIRDLPNYQAHPAPIIALTALAMQGDRERILSEGLDDYVSKPLGREKLEFILEKHLQAVGES